MPKQRMATADIAAEVACLRQRGIVGMRVTNIYDISPKMYVLKLGRSGEDGDKVLLLIESGSRLHTIDAMPDKSDVPSNFSLKLRKHVRTRRLEDIRQLGVDRVVQLTFGSGEATFHLILEFYAQGNVILTDKKYEVLSLLRSHRDDAKGMATMARHIYPIHSVRLRQPVPADALRASLTAPPSYGNSGAESSNDGQKESTAAGEGAGPQDKSKGGGEESPLVLKVALAQAMPYGPLAAEHCALLAKLDPQRCLETAPLTADEQTALLGAVRSFEKWLDSCEEEAPGGCIILSQKQPKGGKAVSSAKAGVKAAHDASEASYEEFQPLLAGGRPFEQYLGRPMLTFPTFDAAVSEFFGKLQGQRLAAQQVQREKATMGKLEAIRSDHVARLATLSNEAKDAEHKAALIEFNLDAVDAALNAVREALASGMDWRDLGRMIKEEKKAGNPVAALIDSLQLEKNRVTLLLRNPFEEEESEDESENEDSDSDTASEEEIQPPKGANKAGKKGDQNGAGRKGPHHSMVYRVDVDLDLSANANACVYYDARRKHSDKARRTLEANERALAAAEKRALDQLERVRMSAKGAAAAAAAARKPYWFERFHWFISSENYLVLSGRDAQQNELLVKRFMRKGDVYVHADLHGASSTIVKNPDPSTPIPPLTLAEAGHACVCRSAAWDAKVVTSAWWVHPEQVSKTAPTGEYLVTGSFMIRGRKNYLPPQPLVMGLAWLFRLEQGSVAAHLGERAPRTLNMAEGATTAADDGVDEKPAGGASGSAEVESEEGEAAPASALDVFMDSSVDTLVGRPAVGGAGTAAATGAAAAAFSRYGLADHLPGSNNTSFSEEVQADGEGGAPGSNAAHQSKRHLSAKERALMKKGGAAAGAPGAAHTKQHHQQQGKKAEGKMPPPPAAGGKQGAGEAEGAAQVTAKGKKAKGRKYEDQDEEDRQLAMALLQSAGQKKDRKQRREERKAKLAARKAANSGVVNQEVTEEDIARLTARLELEEEESNGGGSGQSDDGDGEGVEAAALEQPPSGKADDGRLVGAAAEQSVSGSDGDDGEEDAAAAAQREREEVAELLAEENMAVLDDADKDRLTQLDELTAIPRPEDVLLYAVPVCAPYQVVAGYKYRVKLVPGTLKKGKAYRQGVELLAGRGAAPNPGAQRERELLRAVPEMDGINAMVGGVKLQVAGLQKMQQAKKKAGKKGK